MPLLYLFSCHYSFITYIPYSLPNQIVLLLSKPGRKTAPYDPLSTYITYILLFTTVNVVLERPLSIQKYNINWQNYKISNNQILLEPVKRITQLKLKKNVKMFWWCRGSNPDWSVAPSMGRIIRKKYENNNAALGIEPATSCLKSGRLDQTYKYTIKYDFCGINTDREDSRQRFLCNVIYLF